MATEYTDYDAHSVAHARPAELVRISWGSIFAGALVGLALLAALTLLGMSIGFGTVDPTTDENPLSGVGIGSAVWAAISMVVSFFAAGFVTARMSGQPNKTTAMLHGLTVWSLVTIAMIWLAGTALGSLVGGTMSTISSGASATGSAISSAASFVEKQVSQIDVGQIVPNQIPPEIQSRLEARGLTVENFRTEVQQAVSNSALGDEDLQQLQENAKETAKEIAQNPSDYKAIIKDFVENLTGSGQDVVLNDTERTQIVNRLVQRTGITRAEAEGYIQDIEATAKEARQNIAQAFETAQQNVTQAAEAALNGLTKAAFWGFVGLLVALVAAAIGAVAGSPKHLPRTRV